MGRPLFCFTENAVYEVTTRTFQERFLIRPDARTREIVNGVIARGLELFPAIRLFAYCFLSNHAHLLISSSCGQQFVRFVGYVKQRISCELGRIHDWRDSLWGPPATFVEVVDDASIVARFLYILAHGVKEGLVSSPREWPGASAVPGLLGNMQIEARVFDRDRETRARGRGREMTFARAVTVVLSPIPPWAHLGQAALVRRHRKAVAEIEKASAGRSVLGAAKVQQVDPHDRPRAPKRSVAPRCHASTPRAREEYVARYRRGVDTYRAAAVVYRAGASLERSGFPAGFFVNGSFCIPRVRVGGTRDD